MILGGVALRTWPRGSERRHAAMIHMLAVFRASLCDGCINLFVAHLHTSACQAEGLVYNGARQLSAHARLITAHVLVVAVSWF